MAYMLIWFIMANGSGYIAPQRVEFAEMKCGLDGPIAGGMQLDRLVNPRVVRWTDPKAADKHCDVDIAQRVAGLAHGSYHLATTVMGPDTVKFGERWAYDDYS